MQADFPIESADGLKQLLYGHLWTDPSGIAWSYEDHPGQTVRGKTKGQAFKMRIIQDWNTVPWSLGDCHPMPEKVEALRDFPVHSVLKISELLWDMHHTIKSL